METKPILLPALNVCVALQCGELDKAKELLPQLQAELPAASGEQQLVALKNVLSTALRKRNYNLFKELLESYKESLTALVTTKELALASQEFLGFLVYNICDRRLVGQRGIAHELVVAFTDKAETEVLASFWNEWTSLLARIVRRKWLGEIEWLLMVLLRQLWRSQDLKLWYKVLLQLQMHMTMNCRFDSFEGTFLVYKPLFYSYLVLADFLDRKSLAEAKREELLRLILRSVRDSVNQIARGQMLEQQDIYNALYELWLKDAQSKNQEEANPDVPIWKRPASSSKKLEQRIQRFMQMVITYWSLTNPKSSKKQLRFLQEVMEPRLITPECKNLLKKLS